MSCCFDLAMHGRGGGEKASVGVGFLHGSRGGFVSRKTERERGRVKDWKQQTRRKRNLKFGVCKYA